MTILSLLAPSVAFVLLAAHFYRADYELGILVSLLALVLIFVRRPWAARSMQALLEWLRSAVALVQARSEFGQPFLRLAVILGGVFLLTALSALVFQTRRLQAHYKPVAEGSASEGGGGVT
jgi:type IV secretory pathway TrbD component